MLIADEHPTFADTARLNPSKIGQTLIKWQGSPASSSEVGLLEGIDKTTKIPDCSNTCMQSNPSSCRFTISDSKPRMKKE